MLTRLPDGFSALILGASGGIGRAVIDALLASERPLPWTGRVNRCRGEETKRSYEFKRRGA